MSVNRPDKIVFVGEALVGNEAVDQLVKFNTALRNFSASTGSPRGIDGIILTKFDTSALFPVDPIRELTQFPLYS